MGECMKCIVDELTEKGFHFQLKYYGTNDYDTFYDIPRILDNRDSFFKLVCSNHLETIESLSEYLNYLFFKKIGSLQEIIPLLKEETDKQYFQQLCDAANEQLNNIDKQTLIRFVNGHYKEIFNSNNNKYLLSEITLELIVEPFKSGINDEVFEYLAQDYNYSLLTRFNSFQSRFEEKPELFEKLFHHKTLEEIQQLRFDCVFPIFLYIWNGKNQQLKNIISPIIENIIADTEKLVENSSSDSSNIISVEHVFQKVYVFLKKIKHQKANDFYKYSQQIESKLNDYLVNYGQSITYELPTKEILEHIKTCSSWQAQILSLTHSYKKSDVGDGWISLLAFPSKGEQRIIDLVSSTIASDDYFTLSHQQQLQFYTDTGAATVFAIWHDEELRTRFPQGIAAFLDFISQQCDCYENLANDVKLLHVMLQPVILSDNPEKEYLKPLCYGAAMFICAMTEKLLRTVFFSMMKSEAYVPLTSSNMGSLLSPNNPVMVSIFGEDHIKNLAFFLNSVGDKRIGANIRNRLAHWAEIQEDNLQSMLVAKLLFLYTDILNTVFLHYCSLNSGK